MKDQLSSLVVDRIRTLCRQRGFSIYKLSQMSGITQSTLDNLMGRHTFNPSLKTLVRVANAFGLTVAEFLDFPALNDYSYEDDTDE